jgi:hypothetical protein
MQQALPRRRRNGEASSQRRRPLGKARLRVRLGVAAEMAVRERDRPHGGDAMCTDGTVRCRGGYDDDRNEAAKQDESKQSRHLSPS